MKLRAAIEHVKGLLMCDEDSMFPETRPTWVVCKPSQSSHGNVVTAFAKDHTVDRGLKGEAAGSAGG